MRPLPISARASTAAFGLSGLCLLLLIAGCGDADSPSASSATVPHADAPSAEDVRAQATQQKDAIDRAYHARLSAMKLRVQQLKATATQKGVQADLDRDKTVEPLEVTMQGLVDGVKREKDAIDADAAHKLKDPANQEAAIKADQKRRKEEVELTGSGKMNAVLVKIDHAKAVALEAHQQIDRDLAAALAAENQAILADERSARLRKIDIDYDATVKLDTMKHDAAENDKRRQEQLRGMEQDMKISQAIRARLASSAAIAMPSKDVDIATTNGVVEVSGTVPSESDHRAIIAIAARTDGVQRVNDQLAVK